MQKRILSLLYKWVEKIHTNTGFALRNLRIHLFYLDFEERDTDIYVSTYLKSGTTWMQVILYNLLTDGDMSFNHIYDVSPWPKNEAFNNKSAERINKLPDPRILKTHDPYGNFNKDVRGKFIYVYRDGKDVAVSQYHHNKNYVYPDLDFDKNYKTYFQDINAEMNWFRFVNDWLINKSNFKILYISYEQLQDDFDNTLERIARFVGVQLTEDIINRVKEHSSFKFMKEHEDKFGELPPASQKRVFNEFIRKGKSGEGMSYMNQEQLKSYSENYNKFIRPYLKS